MSLDELIRRELDNFDSVFQGIQIKELNLNNVIGDINYNYGYTLPNLHKSKLQKLFDKKEEIITKNEIIDLFLSMHGLSLAGIAKDEDSTFRIAGIKEIARDSDFEIISDNDHNHYRDGEMELRKRINDWTLSLFFNALKERFNSVKPTDLNYITVSLYHKNKGQNLIKSEELNKIVQNKKFFKFKFQFLNYEKILDYKTFPNKKGILLQDIENFFTEDPELRKINIKEALKDVEDFIISTDYVKYRFDEEYGYLSHYPFLLINGSIELNNIKSNITSMRVPIRSSCGRYLEVSKSNINMVSWNQLKDELILGLRVII